MSETTDQTPEWMLRLENKKKRPHRLAHEIGAGSPCLSCGDACPGLDLHFWRKLCRNCKCKKEEHDVKDDEGYEQFEILLGAGGKKRKTGGVLKVKVPEEQQEGKCAPSEAGKKGVAFDWVPPNVSDDLAAEYMQQLPARKMPISGSDGALYRRQQLEKQVPLHDLDASKCHNLSAEETKALMEYLENLKNNVVGQGCVTKVPVLYAESRLSMRGPHHQLSSSQVLGRSLATSQSADSILSLPPIPPAYNSIPRPFQPSSNSTRAAGNDDDDDDFPPPPLPDSLPPSLDLKTPSAFVPGWTLPRPQDGALSAVGTTGEVARSGEVPGQQWISASDPARAQYQSSTHPTQHGMIGQYPAASGHVVLQQDGTGAQTLHSQSVPGQAASFTAALGSAGSAQGLPQDAGLSVLSPEKGMSQSSGISSSSGRYSQPLAGRGGGAGMQVREPHYGTLPADNGSVATLPHDSSTVSSGVPRGLPRSGAAPGQATSPQYSAELLKNEALAGSRSAKGVAGSRPLHGILASDGFPNNVAQSSAVPGQAYPAGVRQGNQRPEDANISGVKHPHGIAYSSDVPGQRMPGLQGQQRLEDGRIIGQAYPTSVEQGIQRPEDANISGVKPPHGIAYSSNVPGFQGQQILEDGSRVSGQAYLAGSGQGIQRPEDANISGVKQPHGIAHSSIVPGQRIPGSQGLQRPKDAGILGENLPHNIAYSSNIPGQQMPGSYGLQGPANGSLSGSNLPRGIANSSGQRIPGSEDHQGGVPGAYSSNVPRQQIPAMAASLGDHGGVPQYPGTLPVDGVMTSSLGPRGEMVSSAAVATDALPKSAAVMQQSHPALALDPDELAGLVEQLSSGSGGQQGAAQNHLDCPECGLAVIADDVAVFAERAGNDKAWHPQCFVCTTCKELLVDLIYFYHKGKVYCGRHFADLLSIPRCFACDELIFVKEYTVAEGKAFHVRHFCCYECDDPLAGKSYVPVDDQPVCLDCFDLKYGKKCHTCKQKIAAGAQRVGWKDLNWHVEGNCFRCFECSKSLLGGRFVVKENEPFCSKECVQAGLPRIMAQQ